MMEPASPQGSRAKEGGGIKGGPGPRSRRLFGYFWAAPKVSQPVESVERKNRLSFITVNSDRLKNYQVTVNGTSIL